MWQEFLEFVEAHPDLVRAGLIASVATFVASLVLLPLVIGSLPADYFATKRKPIGRLAQQHPYIRGLAVVLRNALGGVLLLMGVVMLVLPGQGLLTLLAALVLLDFPGKRRLELALVRRPRVMRGLNWIRRRAGHPEFSGTVRGGG